MSAQTRTRPDRDCEPRLLDYERERASYVVTVPERFNAVEAIVDTWAEEDPDAPALLSLDGAGEVIARDTARSLSEGSRKAARALLERGVGKGDHVFVMLPRVPQWYAALLGCMRIGAIPMPGPNLLTPNDIAYRVDRGRATVAITDAAGAAKVDRTGAAFAVRLCVGGGPAEWEEFDSVCDAAGDGEVPVDVTHRDDPLLLYFTSGTVDYPKMVQHAHSYALGHVGTARFWHDLRPGDLHWTVTDTGWAKAAWGALFGQMHERACIVQVALGRPDADTIFEILARHGVTSFCAPPTLYRLLVQGDFGKHDLSQLRHCTSAGEPLNPEVIRAWYEGTGGLTVYDGYGQTETTCLVANYRSMPVRPGSMGRPVPGWDVTVVDDDGRAIETGAVGNVVVRYEPNRPVGLFPGYYEDPDATTGFVPRTVLLHGRQGGARRRRLLLVRGAQRRRDHVQCLPDRTVRGRERADRASGRDGGRGRRPRRPGTHPNRRRDLRPGARRAGFTRARQADSGLRQAEHGAVQVPPRGPLCRRAPQDRERQDPPQRASGLVARRAPPGRGISRVGLSPRDRVGSV